MENTCALLVREATEDSVDIYDGLDVCVSSPAESPRPGSHLRESMDLYEELVTEEEQSKEASYAELKSRYQAAQSQIQELRSRLEQMETRNSGLTSENSCLKKNISALLQTARQEVKRKDAEILRLTQWSKKYHYHPQPRFSLQDPNWPQRSLTITSSSKLPPPLPPSLPSPPPLPPPPSDPTPPAPPLPPFPPGDSAQACRTESGEPSRGAKSSSHGPSRRDAEAAAAADRHKSKNREEKHQSGKVSETADRRYRSAPGLGPASEQNRSYRVEGRRHQPKLRMNVVNQSRSEGPKTSSPEVSHRSHSDKKGSSRERKADKTKTWESDRRVPRSSKDVHNRDGEERKNRSSNRQRKGSQHAERCSNSSKERKDREKNHQRKEDRRWGDGGEQKRDCLSETVKEQDNRRERRENAVKIFPENRTPTAEENSPSRKLCFMEILNLTLSPIKKPSSSSGGGDREHPEDIRKTASGDNSLLRLEDMCVIDEADVSEPEAGFSDSSDVSGSEKIQEREIDHCGSEDMADTEATVFPEPKPAESPPCLREEGLLNHQDRVQMNSDRLADQMSGKGSEQETNRKLQSADSGNNTDPAAAVVHLSRTAPRSSFQDSPRPPGFPSPPTETGVSEDTTISTSPISQEQPPVPLQDSLQEPCPPVPPQDPPEGPRSLVPSQDSPQEPCPPVPPQDSLQESHPDVSPQDLSEEPHPPVTPQDSPEKLCPHIPPKDSLQEPHPPPVPPQDSCPPVVPPQDSQEELHPPTVPPQDSRSSHAPPQDSVQESSPHVPPRDSCPAVPPQDSGPAVSPRDSPQAPCPPAPERWNSVRRQSSQSPAASPNTILLESVPQEGLSLTEAILVLAHEDSRDSPLEPGSSTGCAGLSKSGNATEDKAAERLSNLAVTPRNSFSPGRKQEVFSSVPLIHDEDSMMRMLSNLKRIPDAISPLRSPVQITKRNLAQLHGKPGHVKSLQKEFSSAPADAGSKKLDVNKENKYPGSPANRDTPNPVDKAPDPSSGLSDTDLEEGEIVSEPDEATAASPTPAAKRAKLAPPVKNKASPRSVLKRKHDVSCGASKESHEAASCSTLSPKSRFKTVCPAATKASFSTTDDIMETFRLVRTEIRKKYMKLHKTFPKKSFYGVMDNFQESFLEFVDGAQFGAICSHPSDLKSKLKKLITSVFGKVSNNGIVKRIFEQQAVDMKQKLWDFVDAQINYLFREIDTTLQGLCKPSQSDDKKTNRKENKSLRQSPTRKPHCQPIEAPSPPAGLNPTRPCLYRKGLGSRGKDIRITHVERKAKADLNAPNDAVELLPPKHLSTPEKTRFSSVVCQNGPLVDKTSFQLLTEQQASSLTFDLVRDSQMGEIFRCLLQGSDLLESGGDNGAWSLTSPRKDGDRFLSVTTPTKFDSPPKLFSPTKLDTPTKLVAAWASISPCKLSSPRLKDPVHLNPAVFDESCMLEVPLETGVKTQKTFSILAEDLAVSLTIPSPLKSDRHLSFLQPSSSSMHLLSTPDSVISAHISEDALMDGEDATEQDIHLALDTDNSSCDPSSSSGASSPLATPFVFNPDVPMQALVMEKSNDHFIVKIRQASRSLTQTDEDSLDQTLTEDTGQDAVTLERQTNTAFNEMPDECSSTVPPVTNLSNDPEHSAISQTTTQPKSSLPHKDGRKLMRKTVDRNDASPQKCPPNLPYAVSNDSLNTSSQNSDCTIIAEESQEGLGKEDTPPKCPQEVLSHKTQKTISPSEGPGPDVQHHLNSSDKDQQSPTAASHAPETRRDKTDLSESKSCLTVMEDTISSPGKFQANHSKSRKRKKHQKKYKTKRSREEKSNKTSSSKKDEEESQSSTSLSPNSLSAKNVVRKKGEVVIAWTRDEDRAILIALKTEGASRDTFSALSEKLNKPSEQIAHRFHQLMKLFRKMDS